MKIQSTIRFTILILICAISSSSGFAESDINLRIDAAPDHMNLWTVNPLPWFKGESRFIANIVAFNFAPKIAIPAFVTSYAAGMAADSYYGTGDLGGELVCEDEEKNRAEVMAKEMLRTSYLYCFDKESEKGLFAVDDAGKAFEVRGRWGRRTYPFKSSLIMGWDHNAYFFVVEAGTIESLHERCALTLGADSNSVSVRVKDTSYTTKISGYGVVPFSETKWDGRTCYLFLERKAIRAKGIDSRALFL